VISILRLLLTTVMGTSYAPGLATSADSIPGQVPRAVVIHGEPVDGRTLRGDYEVPDRVLMIFTESWSSTTEIIAGQVLESGAQVSFAIEVDHSTTKFMRMVRRLGRSYGERIQVHDYSVDTPWVRDWGPLQVRRGDRSLWLDSDYDDAERMSDDEAPVWLANQLEAELVEFPWALDGGAFISNGEGLCVLTLEYLEAQGISWDEEDLGAMTSQLGCRITALVPTLIGEETKHADMIAQFVARDRLMIAQLVDGLDGASEDALRLEAAEFGIREAARAMGIDLEVVHVPTPPNAMWENPRSYVNGLRLGDRYLMPSYPELEERWDLQAWSAVQDALGDVPVMPVEATDMIGVGGAIHCASLGLF
jgi:agmatine/peptidylarginine deiminase